MFHLNLFCTERGFHSRKEKRKMKILLDSIKLLRILKIFPTAASEFMVWISYSAIGRFSPVSTRGVVGSQPMSTAVHMEPK